MLRLGAAHRKLDEILNLACCQCETLVSSGARSLVVSRFAVDRAAALSLHCASLMTEDSLPARDERRRPLGVLVTCEVVLVLSDALASGAFSSAL